MTDDEIKVQILMTLDAGAVLLRLAEPDIYELVKNIATATINQTLELKNEQFNEKLDELNEDA